MKKGISENSMLHTLWLVLKIIGLILGIILGVLLVLLSIVLFVPISYHIDGIKDSKCEQEGIGLYYSWFFRVFYGYVKYEDKQVISRNFLFGRKLQFKKQAPNKKYTINKFYDMIKKIPKGVNNIYTFLTDGTHQKAFRCLKKELIPFVKKHRPREVNLRLLYGSEDPYKVGKFMAIMSVLYAWYGDYIDIQTNYEEDVIKGQLHIKGRICVLSIVILIFKIYFNESILKTFQDLGKIVDV